MFSHLPPKQRRVIRAALTSAWAMAAAGGLSSLIISAVEGVTLLSITGTVAGAVLTFMATLAALGVATNRYRLEWVSAWFSATALAPYALVYWYSVFTVSQARMSSAFLLTSLLGFFVTRAYMCSAHAERLRLLHEEEVGHDTE